MDCEIVNRAASFAEHGERGGSVYEAVRTEWSNVHVIQVKAFTAGVP